MKSIIKILFVLFSVMAGTVNNISAQLPGEQPLWPNGILNNPIQYKEEKLKVNDYRKSSVSQSNRVFSCVSVPTYIIHKPEKGKANGVALVICPGGGFRDVWFDREGNDLGLWLTQYGVTSLVLKYRTYNPDAEGSSQSWREYFPHVYADAKQAIYILRSQAADLGIDENKIGIAGFSAGGALSLFVMLEAYEKDLPAYADFNQTKTNADFIGLFYPGLDPDLVRGIEKKDSLPPVFIMNGGQDKTTPADNCIELLQVLRSKNVPAELHIYAKGGHGFDSGLERGYGISTWRDSFIAWLKDAGFIEERDK